MNDTGPTCSAHTGSISRLRAARLDQERRVPDVGDAHPVAVDSAPEDDRGTDWDSSRATPLRDRVNCHFRNAPSPLGLHAVRIEEAHAVEMVARSAPGSRRWRGCLRSSAQPPAPTADTAPRASAASDGDWASSIVLHLQRLTCPVPSRCAPHRPSPAATRSTSLFHAQMYARGNCVWLMAASQWCTIVSEAQSQ